MDNENLRNYLSKDEQGQIDSLVERAWHRKMRKKGAYAGPKQFQYFKCQCGEVTEMEKDDVANKKEPWEEEYFEVEIERLLREICGLCLRHGMCPCACQTGKKGNGFAYVTAEDLPF